MSFIPHHINANKDDFKGNGELGRIILLPGSDGRAKKIAKEWTNVVVKEHPRAHNLYLGSLIDDEGNMIDVATISTGMGSASADIIINELIMLGAKNLIRIGTAGSMQPQSVKAGSIVIPTASVRDETTTLRYLPGEVPALPSLDFILAAKEAEKSIAAKIETHFGIVHSKDSLMAREFLLGPQKEENKRYMELLEKGGVLASEMETSILFILGTVYNFEGVENKKDIITGAVLAVIGDDTAFSAGDIKTIAENNSIEYCQKIISELYKMKCN